MYSPTAAGAAHSPDVRRNRREVTERVFEIILIIGLVFVLFWFRSLYYLQKRGLNEVITGLSSIDDRLARLEREAEALRRSGGSQSGGAT